MAFTLTPLYAVAFTLVPHLRGGLHLGAASLRGGLHLGAASLRGGLHLGAASLRAGLHLGGCEQHVGGGRLRVHRTQVRGEVRAADEAASAQVAEQALARAAVRVRQLVLLQRVLPLEPLLAHIALERPALRREEERHAVVRAHVLLQVAVALEGARAHVACELARVRIVVRLAVVVDSAIVVVVVVLLRLQFATNDVVLQQRVVVGEPLAAARARPRGVRERRRLPQRGAFARRQQVVRVAVAQLRVVLLEVRAAREAGAATGAAERVRARVQPLVLQHVVAPAEPLPADAALVWRELRRAHQRALLRAVAPLVYQRVLAELRAGDEAPLAQAARVRPLAGVRAHVHREVRAYLERLLANGARERPLVGVRQRVRGELRRRYAAEAARVAAERPVRPVRPLVVRQPGDVREARAALGARVRPLARVPTHVPLQHAALEEDALTVRARERRLVGVPLPVADQRALAAERLRARAARE